MLPAARYWANALLRAHVSPPLLGPPSAQPSKTNLLVQAIHYPLLLKRPGTKTALPLIQSFIW